MVPQVTTLEDLKFLYEEYNKETGKFHTTFALFDKDDFAYFGSLDLPKRDINLKQLAFALTLIPDEHLFPRWTRLLEEAKVMEKLSQHSHPHIIRYYGCYVRRGRIVGLVLDRHSDTLAGYLKNKVGSMDKKRFMQALESAIRHLHSLNWAHNDLNPDNILVDEAGMPVLIDFGSAREIGVELGASRGTKGWIDGEMKDYHTSDSGHDFFALEKIRTWLDSPTFDD